MPRYADGVAFMITDTVASGASQCLITFKEIFNLGFAAAAPAAAPVALQYDNNKPPLVMNIIFPVQR